MKRHRRRVLVATTGTAAVIALIVSTALIVVPALGGRCSLTSCRRSAR
jgi:hypothetical protein